MKQACTFTDAIQRSKTADQQSWYVLVEPHTLAMDKGRLYLTQEGEARQLEPTEWATGQLCTKLGIPTGYFKRCPSELQDAQYSYWMGRFAAQSKGRQLFLRARASTLRGVLSAKYACIDNSSILDAVEPLIEQGLMITWFELTDVSFHLRLVSPNLDNMRPDTIFAGVHIANSEVGMRTLTVNAVLYRQVCSNGLIWMVRNQDVYARKYIGHQPQNLPEIVFESSRQAQSSYFELGELGSNCHLGFEKASPKEKRELLKTLCSNCLYDGRNVQLLLQEPFKSMLEICQKNGENREIENWLPAKDSNLD